MNFSQDSQASKEINFSTQASSGSSGDQQNNTSNIPPVNAAAPSASDNNTRRVPLAEIELVKNLIERCLQLYMTTNEIVNTLQCRAKIEPEFTSVVLAELEEKNPSFFENYHVGVTLKRQIIILNQLMERQYQMQCALVPSTSMQNRNRDLPVNSIHMRYPILQQPPIQPPVHPQIDSLGSGSGCHVINGISDGSNFCPIQFNSVNRMVMDRIAADTLTPSPAGGVKSDIAMNHVSVASGGHFQFPSDLSYTSALELKYLFQGLGSKWSLPDDQTGNQFEFHNNASQVPSTSSLSDLAAVFSNVGDNTESGNYTQWPFLQAGPDVPLMPMHLSDNNELGNYTQSPFLQAGLDVPLMPLHLSDNTELGNYTQTPFLQAGPDVPLMPVHLSDNTELGNYTQSPFLQAGPDVPLNSEVHTDVDIFTFNSNPVPATYLQEKR